MTWDLWNPFDVLADGAGKVVADGWTAAMLGLWNAGLWVLRLVLNLMDAFVTPDLSADGPGAELYRTTFWIAGTLCTVMVLVQLGVAAFRRDGKSLATAVIGIVQFVMVWATWMTCAVAVVAACGGLSKALMLTLLSVDSWAAFQPFQPLTFSDVSTEPTVATVLGLLGLLLWVAAIGHLLVMLTRAGALMVLSATAPISAAGLVSEAGRSWFWKSLRWFLAAAFTPVLMVLVLGIGIQMTTGVATGLTDKIEQDVGTAVPGVVLILIGSFSPLALFKLLAFVDPGTSSGAGMRRGLAASGGLQGLLAGGASASGSAAGSGSTSGAASSTDANGASAGESAGQDAATNRFAQALKTIGGPIGTAAAKGLGTMGAVANAGVAVGSDQTNQMGVGQQSYQPDFSRTKSSDGGSGATPQDQGPGPRREQGSPDGAGGPSGPVDPSSGATSPDQATAAITPPAPPDPGGGGGGGGGGSAGPKGGPAGGSGGGGAAGSAADVAAVAVV